METRKFIFTFTEPVLGTCPGNKEIMSEFVAAKNPNGIDPDEVDAVPSVAEELQKATTFFARSKNGNPMLWDYQVKGFLKDGALAMITAEICTQDQLKKVGLTKYTYKRTIDQLVHVGPRQIEFANCPKELPFTERPLRAETMKGERIALAKSETIPAGSWIEVEISVLRPNLWASIEWILEYGKLRGIGQWRNSGMGRFEHEERE